MTELGARADGTNFHGLRFTPMDHGSADRMSAAAADGFGLTDRRQRLRRPSTGRRRPQMTPNRTWTATTCGTRKHSAGLIPAGETGVVYHKRPLVADPIALEVHVAVPSQCWRTSASVRCSANRESDAVHRPVGYDDFVYGSEGVPAPTLLMVRGARWP